LTDKYPKTKEIAMPVRRIYATAVTAITLLLTACGGGGGANGSTGPVSSTETFQLRQAWINSLSSSSQSFTLSGTDAGIAITGSGTFTSGSLSSTVFESQPALQQVSVATGTVTGGGQTNSLAITQTIYVDSNYIPLGSSGSEYEVISGASSIPLTARVNDTGVLYQSVRYTSSAKTARLGTSTTSFVLEPDTSSTALLKVINIEKNTNGWTTSTDTETFRITPSGSLTRLSETTSEGNNTLTVTYR
jgi:hypothetical protein